MLSEPSRNCLGAASHPSPPQAASPSPGPACSLRRQLTPSEPAPSLRWPGRARAPPSRGRGTGPASEPPRSRLGLALRRPLPARGRGGTLAARRQPLRRQPVRRGSLRLWRRAGRTRTRAGPLRRRLARRSSVRGSPHRLASPSRRRLAGPLCRITALQARLNVRERVCLRRGAEQRAARAQRSRPRPSDDLPVHGCLISSARLPSRPQPPERCPRPRGVRRRQVVGRLVGERGRAHPRDHPRDGPR